MTQSWDAERIRETMRDNGHDWFPPSAKTAGEIADREYARGREPESTGLELFQTEQAQRRAEQASISQSDPATDWTVMDPTTQQVRNITESELFNLSEQIRDGLDDTPELTDPNRRFTEASETTVAQLTVPDPTLEYPPDAIWGQVSARSTWEQRMAQNQPGVRAADRQAAMARHPSARQVPPPQVAQQPGLRLQR